MTVHEEFEAAANTMFVARKAEDCIADGSRQPLPRRLFDEFWYEGEFCVLFGGTGVGKSVLGVQIADAISRGEPVNSFEMDVAKQKLLYFDFELTDKQFEGRYTYEYRTAYRFDENFVRVVVNPEGDAPKFASVFFRGFERTVKEHDARVVVIDSFDGLKSRVGNFDAAREAYFLNELRQLKNKYNLSILLVCHTARHNQSTRITLNSLAGNRTTAAFADSVFAIGQSHADPELRYLLQLKGRTGSMVYHTYNVAVCRLSKPFNFTGFDFEECGNEMKHLGRFATEADMAIVRLKRAKPSLSLREIADRLGVNRMRVKRVLDVHCLFQNLLCHYTYMLNCVFFYAISTIYIFWILLFY